jgi:hypothetical protein
MPECLQIGQSSIIIFTISSLHKTGNCIPVSRSVYRVPTPPPPSKLRSEGKAGRKHLKKEITPLLPTEIGERFSQTISNLGHAALLRRSELPL